MIGEGPLLLFIANPEKFCQPATASEVELF